MKKLLAIILTLIIAFSFCGCEEIVDTLSDSYLFKSEEEIIAAEQEIIRLGFMKDKDTEYFDEFITLKELDEWENPYKKYRSSVMYDNLSENEQIIYRALEYALAKSYRYTYLDMKVLSNPNVGDKVVNCLAFDSPLVEQNLVSFCYSNVTTFYDVEIPFREPVNTLFRHSVIDVANFKKELLEKKDLAIKEAEKVYATIDKSGTKEALLRRLYTLVAENVKYTDYDIKGAFTAENLPAFLYDGVVNKKTQCDGVTNTLALYLNLAGFKNVDKVDAYELGHTWNCVELDGKWYNLDATWNFFIPKKDTSMGMGLYYCFGDSLQACGTDFPELYPKCESSLFMQPDAFLENYTASQFYKAAENSLKKHNKKWGLVVVDKYKENTISYQLGKLCYYYNLDFYYYYDPIIKDKYYILFAPKNAFKVLNNKADL